MTHDTDMVFLSVRLVLCRGSSLPALGAGQVGKVLAAERRSGVGSPPAGSRGRTPVESLGAKPMSVIQRWRRLQTHDTFDTQRQIIEMTQLQWFHGRLYLPHAGSRLKWGRAKGHKSDGGVALLVFLGPATVPLIPNKLLQLNERRVKPSDVNPCPCPCP